MSILKDTLRVGVGLTLGGISHHMQNSSLINGKPKLKKTLPFIAPIVSLILCGVPGMVGALLTNDNIVNFVKKTGDKMISLFDNNSI